MNKLFENLPSVDQLMNYDHEAVGACCRNIFNNDELGPKSKEAVLQEFCKRVIHAKEKSRSAIIGKTPRQYTDTERLDQLLKAISIDDISPEIGDGTAPPTPGIVIDISMLKEKLRPDGYYSDFRLLIDRWIEERSFDPKDEQIDDPLAYKCCGI